MLMKHSKKANYLFYFSTLQPFFTFSHRLIWFPLDTYGCYCEKMFKPESVVKLNCRCGRLFFSNPYTKWLNVWFFNYPFNYKNAKKLLSNSFWSFYWVLELSIGFRQNWWMRFEYIFNRIIPVFIEFFELYVNILSFYNQSVQQRSCY